MDKQVCVSHNVIFNELSKVDTADIMVPHSEVRLINQKTSFQEIIDIVTEDGHSRFPVFAEKVDNIVGILYVKDLLQFYQNPDINFKMDKILRKPLFVSENKKASELLTEFREAQVHVAIVVDEYGTMVGLVSLEDILEVIIGDINDEYDKKEEDEELQVLSKTEYIVSSKTSLDDFNKMMKSRLESEDYDTLGGFLIERFGYVPAEGESLEFQNLLFMIKEAAGSRIKRILVKKL